MSEPCNQPLAFETLVAYFAADLADDAQASVEEHLMGCASCARRAERIAAITETLRHALPPLLTPQTLQALQQKGLRIRDNPIAPGEVNRALMTPDFDVVVHRLTGLALADAVRVTFEMRAEGTDHVLIAVDDAPFDREGNAVLIACHMHYASLPHDVVAEVRSVDREGRERLARYTIHHVFG